MRMIWNKGHRIRASDKHLVYHFSIETLLFVFVAVLLLLNSKQLMRTDWEHFSLSENGLTLSPYNFITILIATGVCALVAFGYYRFCYDSFKKLLHRQKLARMILENKWYEADTVQDSGFFTDLQSRSREKIVWFPKIYYQMEKGLLHIRCEITLGKYQDQLLRLEDKLESGLYCELTDKTLHDGYIEYTLLYDMIANRITIDEVRAENGCLRLMKNLVWEYDALPHALIAGGTGGGKTYFLLTLIEALLHTNAVLYILGVMDVFGSHVDRCSVEGVNEGFTVHSNNTIDQKNKSEIAGGFTGYADLGRLSENKVTGLKQVTSGQIAGGFAGKTTFAYLANINLDSELVKGLVTVVNQILKALWLDELQKGQVIKIDLGIIEIDALYDGKLVSLNLLGLDIKVGLAEDKSLATIYIGDSKIEINCSESGTIDEESLKNEINISLIKANRTKIDKCTVTGIADGYDVYGGGAGNNANGTGQYGIAGGFVGWNNEGLLENNNMFFADVIRGAKDLTGPFTGKSSLNSNWEFNDVKGIEGNENYYRIYRNGDTAYEKLFGKSGKELQHNYETSDAWKNVYTIRHMTKDKVVKFTDLKDAMMSGSAGQIPVNVYQEDGAMAVLMNNTASSPTEPGGNEEAPDVQDPCKDLIELRLKKVWKRDEEKDRPNEVIFNITRSYEKDGKPVVDTNFNKEVILTKKDAQTSDIWEKVLTGAEYTAYHVGTDGKKYYYTYHVSEMKVDGYTTEITYKGDRQYSITVTNTKNWFDSLLPETGGMGKALLYTLGVLLLCLVTATEYRKRKSTRSQSSYK